MSETVESAEIAGITPTPGGLTLPELRDHAVLQRMGATRIEDRDDVTIVWPETLDVSSYDAAVSATIKADLLAYARLRGYEKRVSGTLIDGVAVKTDPDSLTLMSGMVALAQMEPDRIFSFDSGAAVATLNAEAAISLATAVGAWVQATFDARATLLAAIEAGTVTTKAQIDAAYAAL